MVETYGEGVRVRLKAVSSSERTATPEAGAAAMAQADAGARDGAEALMPASDPARRMRTAFGGLVAVSMGMSAAFFAHAVHTVRRMQHITDVLSDDSKAYKYAISGNMVIVGFCLCTIILYSFVMAFITYRACFGDRHRNRARTYQPNPLAAGNSVNHGGPGSAPRRGALHGAWIGMAYCACVQCMSASAALITTKPMYDALDDGIKNEDDKINPQRITELSVLGFLSAIPHFMVVIFLIFFVDVLYGVKSVRAAGGSKPVGGNAFDVRANALAEDAPATQSHAATGGGTSNDAGTSATAGSVFGQRPSEPAPNVFADTAPTMEADSAKPANPFSSNPWGN